jgi:hypothetical protein
MPLLTQLTYLTAAALTAACASTGATFQSGVGNKSFDKPPYYAGAAVTPDERHIAHLPIRYQHDRDAASFEPRADSGTPAALLVAEMNAYLDSLTAAANLSTKLSPASPEIGTPPDVRFGCNLDIIGDCPEAGEANPMNRRLELSVARPSRDWIAWFGNALADTSYDRALLITLELGQYWPRQKGLGLSKEVRLGTDYMVPVPWLTSLEQPVAVVQLTGALIGRDGRAIRIGAEGLIAKRSHILLSALGAQHLMKDEDVERLRTLRREDLPGQPLVWRVALQNLVSQLTGRTETAAR